MKRAIMLCIILAACASAGHPFDMARLGQLRPGVTTIEESKALLGEPVSVSSNQGNGHTLLTWAYSHAGPVGGGVESAAVAFDEQGRMLKVVQVSKF